MIANHYNNVNYDPSLQALATRKHGGMMFMPFSLQMV
jgi:hypothetical protein